MRDTGPPLANPAWKVLPKASQVTNIVEEKEIMEMKLNRL